MITTRDSKIAKPQSNISGRPAPTADSTCLPHSRRNDVFSEHFDDILVPLTVLMFPYHREGLRFSATQNSAQRFLPFEGVEEGSDTFELH